MTSSNSTQLQGRTAVVTGSTSGIGAAIALTLAAHGAKVVVSGRDPERGKALAARISETGGTAAFVDVDLAGSYDELREFAARTTDALGGRVDILVNNAGIYPATATADLPDDQLDAMLAVNVRAPHVLVGELAPAMAERGSGVIVNIGSWMATMGSPFAAMYSATKAADEQLTRSWAAEFGPRGVRVNALAPGATLTPGNEDARQVLDAMTAGTPAGTVLSPQNIADGVLFLVSDDAAMVHGTTLYVDGGISVTRG
ncbi:SDR family oxidoreductase [Rhodococcus fascians]|uniref:SDR family NAD(P)-dependent oxidoreductase n=1 Tax=unclassified Rhodococcus (in: high G+C Gram-positive bacteria) TaxID=192944 RepID=UPI000B9C33C0|nr:MULTISPECIES: SDR family oxidoreductase [unclassified Rhodococcus (in: high G+C Gram-positive bacteria)]MBY3794344.1 SDR family oxidoreductase [Rhodococcus fascians]MBY3827102.1 SDR family oxidoreductase [Rhodococcus fascians]MBY3837562.1 SDR family oxidoreductase [Rhodococcus fascians]MBY3866834.1 SDR family oxidoreductase [Rhodococcus fascians]MBY3885896.1 SDR family oxidoreductase [Rhodococcus fascians]